MECLQADPNLTLISERGAGKAAPREITEGCQRPQEASRSGAQPRTERREAERRPQLSAAPHPPSPRGAGVAGPHPGNPGESDGPFRRCRAPSLAMQLPRALRFWRLGASAGLLTAARAPVAPCGHGLPPRPRTPPARPLSRPGLRLRLARGSGLQHLAAAAAASSDAPSASAAAMDPPGAGEPGLPSGPGGAAGIGAVDPRSALILGEGRASPTPPASPARGA